MAPTKRIVLVSDLADASLRWAGNSMTSNGASVSRSTTVISIVRKGDSAQVGSVESSEVEPAAIPALVAASQAGAQAAPAAPDSLPCSPARRCPATGTSRPDAPAPTPSPAWPARCRGASPGPTCSTASPTTPSKRLTWPPRPGCIADTAQPTGSVEINAKRDGRRAPWAATSTPWFVDVPTDGLLEELSVRLGWAARTVELPAGALRDDHAAVDRVGHDDLPWLDDGRPVAPRRAATHYRPPAGGHGWGRSSPIWA